MNHGLMPERPRLEIQHCLCEASTPSAYFDHLAIVSVTRSTPMLEQSSKDLLALEHYPDYAIAGMQERVRKSISSTSLSEFANTTNSPPPDPIPLSRGISYLSNLSSSLDIVLALQCGRLKSFFHIMSIMILHTRRAHFQSVVQHKYSILFR